jgi:hypothetical protein
MNTPILAKEYDKTLISSNFLGFYSVSSEISDPLLMPVSLEINFSIGPPRARARKIAPILREASMNFPAPNAAPTKAHAHKLAAVVRP